MDDLQEKMLYYLDINYWANGRDVDIIKEFIKDFFLQYQPKSKEESDR
jgi:hypothetical protein